MADLFGGSAGAVVTLVVVLVVTFTAAGAGGLASARAGEFYRALAKPAWAPSPAVFGPVWTVLYTLMAVAAFLAARSGAPRTAVIVALALYAAQLVSNALWTWLFFSRRSGAAAFADVVVLLLLVAATLAAFWRIRPTAGALLVPYLAWVAFATALTWSVWRRNPGML